MILVTGGSGFIGSHTVRALADLGESCVIIQRRSAGVPAHLAGLPVVSEQVDVADLEALRALGTRHTISGIVHLAGYPAPRGGIGGIESSEDLLRGLINVVRVAGEWGVRRIGLASTIGVYGGIQHVGPLTEDLPVLLTAPHPIPRSKKIGELLGEQLAETTGIEIINLRISGTWGPIGSRRSVLRRSCADSRRRPPQSTEPVQPAQDSRTSATDSTSATSRTPDGPSPCCNSPHTLNHRTYNVASGRVTTNADIIDAIRTIDPDVELELPDGPAHPGNPLDITRLHDDTGYQPEYDTAHAAADYIDWLRAGNSH